MDAISQTTYLSFDSPNFVPKGPNNYIPALVQIWAWHRPHMRHLAQKIL